MANHLMGLETEYALTHLGRPGEGPLERIGILDRLFRLVTLKPHFPAYRHHMGCFLENGALLYLDCGNHIEYATPECTSPGEVVRYQLAGERLLADLAQELSDGERKISDMAILKCNVDYADGSHSSWGCHESYLCKGSPVSFARQLIPFLVSRLIYTGAGGFNSLIPGLEFLISPRAEFLVEEVSRESTFARGIFHTKDEPLSKVGFHRLHLICGESNCSETATFLKLGATALVTAMAEAGLCPGDRVALRSPVKALHQFSRDPECKQAVAGRHFKTLTALDIQRHYLALAEAHMEDDFMPPWGRQVVQVWRSVLDRIESGAPESVKTTLDWAIKFAVFRERVHRQGFSWEKFLHKGDRPLDGIFLRGDRPTRRDTRRLSLLRNELFEIDLRFSQLGERGIFAAVDGAGCLEHHIDEVNDVLGALKDPPTGTRARMRGQIIKRVPGTLPQYIAEWDRIHDLWTGSTMDLTDPFEQEEKWKDSPNEGRGRRGLNARFRRVSDQGRSISRDQADLLQRLRFLPDSRT